MCMSSSPRMPKASTLGRGTLAVAERTGNTHRSGYKELKEKLGPRKTATQSPSQVRPRINTGVGYNGSGVGLNV